MLCCGLPSHAEWQEPEGGTSERILAGRLADKQDQLRKTRQLLHEAGTPGRGSARRRGAPVGGAGRSSRRGGGGRPAVNPHSRVAKMARTVRDDAEQEGFEDDE